MLIFFFNYLLIEFQFAGLISRLLASRFHMESKLYSTFPLFTSSENVLFESLFINSLFNCTVIGTETIYYRKHRRSTSQLLDAAGKCDMQGNGQPALYKGQ